MPEHGTFAEALANCREALEDDGILWAIGLRCEANLRYLCDASEAYRKALDRKESTLAVIEKFP